MHFIEIYITTIMTHEGRQPTSTAIRHRLGRACGCFFGAGCCTARRGLRLLRSFIYIICFVYRVLFTGCMYVTIIGESSPCKPFVILDVRAASHLVGVCSRHVEAIAICAI